MYGTAFPRREQGRVGKYQYLFLSSSKITGRPMIILEAHINPVVFIVNDYKWADLAITYSHKYA